MGLISIGYSFNDCTLQVPKIDWEGYDVNTRNIVDVVVKELVACDDLC